MSTSLGLSRQILVKAPVAGSILVLGRTIKQVKAPVAGSILVLGRTIKQVKAPVAGSILVLGRTIKQVKQSRYRPGLAQRVPGS